MTADFDWIEIVDPSTKRPFFANPTTGECLLKKPIKGTTRSSSPGGDWWELWDDKHNLPYYYHTGSGVTEWTKPNDVVVLPLIKIQSSSAFRKPSMPNTTQRHPSSLRDSDTKLKRNSRSLDLPVNTSLRYSLHQRSNSQNDLDVPVMEPTDSVASNESTSPSASSSLLSAVLPNASVLQKFTTNGPTRKQSLRSQNSDPSPVSTTSDTRSRRISHFMNLSNLSPKPLRQLVNRPNPSISQPVNNPNAAIAMHPTLGGASLVRPAPPAQPSLPIGLKQDIKKFAIDGFAQKYFSTHKKGLFRRKVPMTEMLQWTKDSIRKPLIMMNNDLYKDVSKCFKLIQMIMGDRPLPRNTTEIDSYQTILNFGITKGQMRDEIYVQVCKQLHFNPSVLSIKKGWEILCVLSVTFPPSKNLENYLTNFVREQRDESSNPDVQTMSAHVLSKLTRICKRGAKGKVLTPAEIQRAKVAPFSPSVFGESIPFIMTLQKDPNLKIPRIVPFLAEAVQQMRGDQSEGIFRVPGDADEVTDLRVRIENGQYDTSGLTDPNVPASLLKYWLRDLSEPLIPTHLYNDCLATSEQADKAIGLINQMPETNRRIALYVISLLQEFTHPDVIKVTLMNINNLAMVFAPNFLRCPSESLTTVFENSKYEQAFLRTLIRHLQVDRAQCLVAQDPLLATKNPAV
ncbi:hypothetical protein DM01DRAFT_1331024 [Hesseltinella vesiculosa]|uniref:RhoGAP-domain-containing protein n=1 Tax=Hesseltinella vesiculosa TaxID=101127 RepID=A0A1X2GXV5_9FUNG|nr:hypothetical protein DM01DRAFT_1331024 [Hesseltinella vesiculosa]